MTDTKRAEAMKALGEMKGLQHLRAMIAAHQGCNLRTFRARNIDAAILPGNDLKHQQAIHMADQLEADIRSGKSLADATEALVASGQLARYEDLEG